MLHKRSEVKMCMHMLSSLYAYACAMGGKAYIEEGLRVKPRYVEGEGDGGEDDECDDEHIESFVAHDNLAHLPEV